MFLPELVDSDCPQKRKVEVYDGHKHFFAMSSAKFRIESEQSAENDKAQINTRPLQFTFIDVSWKRTPTFILIFSPPETERALALPPQLKPEIV
jgi:hypothetical protein